MKFPGSWMNKWHMYIDFNFSNISYSPSQDETDQQKVRHIRL